jgi:transposase-like protein
MDCPKCKNTSHVKAGKTNGRQRFKCKDCLYYYTVERKSDVKTSDIRRLALVLYLEGFGFRRIGRILSISYGTVYAWVQAWHLKMPLSRRERPAEKVELEKLSAHIESKKSADCGHGLLLIDLEEDIVFFSGDSASTRKC